MIEHNFDSTKGTFINYIGYAQAANTSATFIKFEVVTCASLGQSPSLCICAWENYPFQHFCRKQVLEDTFQAI